MKFVERTTYDAEFTREEHDTVHKALSLFTFMPKEKEAFCAYMADCLSWGVDDFTADFEQMFDTLTYIADYM